MEKGFEFGLNNLGLGSEDTGLRGLVCRTTAKDSGFDLGCMQH